MKWKEPGVFVLLDSLPSKMGELIKLDHQGLTFRYLVDGYPLLQGSTYPVAIMIGSKGFQLQQISATVISDQLEHTLPTVTLPTRLVVLKFVKLEDEQRCQLEDLLGLAVRD